MNRRRRAIAFGESVIDVYPDRSVVAGAPLHAAAHVAARGWDASLITRLGDDDDGRRMRAVLLEHGVDDSMVEVDPSHRTGRVTVDMSGPDNRFEIERPAAWDFIEGPPRLPPHDLFYYGTLASRSECSAATLTRLLGESGADFRILDVNLRPPDVDAAVLASTIRAATAIKLNTEELAEVARMLEVSPTPEALFAPAAALRFVCVTKGGQGAELYDRSGQSWSLIGRAVEVVDSVGAGDAFTAGLATSLVDGASGERALQEAQEAAVSVLTQRGGLPTPGAEKQRRVIGKVDDP